MSISLAPKRSAGRSGHSLESAFPTSPRSASMAHLPRLRDLLARITCCIEGLKPRLGDHGARTQRDALLNWSVVVAGMLLAVLPQTALSTMHKCKSPDGRIAYSDQPCTTTEARAVIKQAPPHSEVQPAGIPTAAPAGPSLPAVTQQSRRRPAEESQSRPTPTASLEEQVRQFDCRSAPLRSWSSIKDADKAIRQRASSRHVHRSPVCEVRRSTSSCAPGRRALSEEPTRPCSTRTRDTTHRRPTGISSLPL
ncbi:DUF4124 domain-containing protein [Rhizobacter sp. J219]|uniref:DUF4124 domain-containing protein n=1 Tax=Rhizobacter sp. J219 TaxID=2898430 RepID=UPI0035B34DB0